VCDNRYCLWCRELERKQKSYSKIKNPKHFQKNEISKKLLTLRNHFRLKKFNYISYKKKKPFKPNFRIPKITTELNNFVEDAHWTIIDYLNLRPKHVFPPQIKKKKTRFNTTIKS